MEISKVVSLFNESGRETVCVGFVVDELSMHKVIDLTWKDPLRLTCQSSEIHDCSAHVPNVFEGGRATKDVVLDNPEKRFGLFSLLLEVIRCIEILDVLLESRTIGPGLKRAIITRFNSLDLEKIILGLFT